MPGRTLRPDQYYVDPGSLWWAFNPERAHHRGLSDLPAADGDRAVEPGAGPVNIDGRPDSDDAVLLLDEIDKADPDVPNDLLEPLDLKRFTVRETNDVIEAARDVLVILTTNGERELPPAFMRRCVSITLDPPTEEWFSALATSKFGRDDLHEPVAVEVMRYRTAAQKHGLREPSAGEYLDALEVCRELDITTGSEAWRSVAMSVLWKHEEKPHLDRETDGA
jgi:MoxR-like ATPase